MTRAQLKQAVLQALQSNNNRRGLGPQEIAIDIGFSGKGEGPAAVVELVQELVAEGTATCYLETQQDGGTLPVYEAL